ncbi:MAG: T9SS type A sorting domain-containing protein, partial [Candidatus Marinimicrobia bacterium]|nr:T9SS type A sorting domain-containing protein [Candidatus Neomarinimicrobiota bacterium]
SDKSLSKGIQPKKFFRGGEISSFSVNNRTNSSAGSASDSIRISIDPLTHVAWIFGTPNYYTDFQDFVFYVSDGDSSDSIDVNIAVESVNDKPVLDSLPAITFYEDSLYVMSLSDWDTLVYDVEDSVDTLNWSFTMDGMIYLDYDTTAKQIVLFGGLNYSGSAELTVVVTDLGGLSDTAFVTVEILPMNDPPQIDSSFFAIGFNQKDTVEYLLDNYVSDSDHNDTSLVWQFDAGDLVYINYTAATRSVRFWSDIDRFGVDSVLAIVTDPMGGVDSQFVTVTVTDTTRPSFELAIFQNQLASRYVEIDVYPSERLGAGTSVLADGESLIVSREMDADSVTYYNATYQIEDTRIVQIDISGTDLAGNDGHYSYKIGVSKISRETGGALTDPDSIMSFLFAANAVPMDMCAMFIPYKREIRSDTALAKGSFMDDDFPVSDEFDFRIPLTRLDDNARIMFSLDRMQFLQQYATDLGIYKYVNGEWQYLKTYTSLEKGSYWAYSATPGIYQIRVNSMNPAVVLPEEISISQNYPNPFNSLTTIKYTIGAGGFVTFDEAFEQLTPYHVSIKVYNILGQEVATIVNEKQLPGFYSVTWNGINKNGKPLATGLYIYRVIIGDKVFHKKMTILK